MDVDINIHLYYIYFNILLKQSLMIKSPDLLRKRLNSKEKEAEQEVLVLFAGIRERLELADIPESFRGFPITLIAAGLMSIAFLGFTGLIKL